MRSLNIFSVMYILLRPKLQLYHHVTDDINPILAVISFLYTYLLSNEAKTREESVQKHFCAS